MLVVEASENVVLMLPEPLFQPIIVVVNHRMMIAIDPTKYRDPVVRENLNVVDVDVHSYFTPI